MLWNIDITLVFASALWFHFNFRFHFFRIHISVPLTILPYIGTQYTLRYPCLYHTVINTVSKTATGFAYLNFPEFPTTTSS